MKNGKYLILFAEDYEDILQSELMMAEMRGWEAIGVTTARGMIEVFNSLCANPSGSCCIDCIVADIQFHHSGNGPRLTGIGAVNSIRQSYPNIPVLYYSGYVNTMRIYKKAARVLVVGPTKYFANRAYSKLVAEDPDQFQFPLDKMMSIYSSHGGIIQFAETRSCIRGAINKSLFGLSWFYIASSYAKSDPTPDEVKRAFDVVDDRTRYEPRIVVKTNVDGIIIGD
jgi:CheY-like chemotaxis protein